MFKTEILPILFKNEDRYAMLYGKTGRPNFSVTRVLGLCLLQEFNTLSDQQALDAFSFDIRWRHALDVGENEAYLSRRSLVEFRRRLAAKDPEMTLVRNVFDNIRDSAIKKLGLSARDQRLDSTLVISNIRIRGRLALFSNTLTVFLRSLTEDQFSRVPKKIRKWHSTESEGWFGLGPAEQKVKLDQLAQYVYKLIAIFAKDDQVKSSEPYQLLERLFHEQCEIKKESGPDSEIITDYEVHGAARSDMGKALSVTERLEAAGLKPETLFADGGYPSVPSALKVVEQGIEFLAPVNRSRLPDEVVGRDRFQFDSEGFAIKCPMGRKPIDHRVLSGNNTTRRSLHAIFDGDICRSCKMLDRCPVRTPNHRDCGCQPCDTAGDFRLEITPEIRLRDQMYCAQQTAEWKNRYRIRSGIEATLSELKRSHGVGRLRVRRAVKVCFAVACKVIACNIKRWAAAHFVPESALRGLLISFWTRMKSFHGDPIRTSLCLRVTFAPLFR